MLDWFVWLSSRGSFVFFLMGKSRIISYDFSWAFLKRSGVCVVND